MFPNQLMNAYCVYHAVCEDLLFLRAKEEISKVAKLARSSHTATAEGVTGS